MRAEIENNLILGICDHLLASRGCGKENVRSAQTANHTAVTNQLRQSSLTARLFDFARFGSATSRALSDHGTDRNFIRARHWLNRGSARRRSH